MRKKYLALFLLPVFFGVFTGGNSVRADPFTDAHYEIGLMYFTGKGETKNYTEAAKWFRLAAEAGHLSAQYNLGAMYGKGLGVTQDFDEAFKWYRKAVEQGHAKALVNFGLMHSKGNGVPLNNVEAYKWFKIASSIFPAGKYRDMAIENRDIVAKKMTAGQVAQAEALVKEWKPKAKKK